MSHQAVHPVRFGTPLAQSIGAVVRAAGVALAHVRDAIGRRDPLDDRGHLAGMNLHMRRDVGLEGSIGPHASAHRDLLYPRL